jgi:hypothetical protein
VNRLHGFSKSAEGTSVELQEHLICRMEDKAVAVGNQPTGRLAKNLDIAGVCSDHRILLR